MSGPTPSWSRSFQRHDPLTLRIARTTAEIEDDPRAWWIPPNPAEDAERRSRRVRRLDALCMVLGWILLIGLMVVAAFTRTPG